MTEKTAPVYTAPIASAPKTGETVVVIHPSTFMYINAAYDAEWGNGRGAWFQENGTVVSPRHWNPEATKNLALKAA